MDDLQMKYRSGEIAPEDYIHELERRLAESESNVQELVAAQVDAVLESDQTTPLLLRQAQLALQRSNELLEQRVTERTAALAAGRSITAFWKRTPFLNARQVFKQPRGCECARLPPTMKNTGSKSMAKSPQRVSQCDLKILPHI
jgi:hypothetical protein